MLQRMAFRSLVLVRPTALVLHRVSGEISPAVAAFLAPMAAMAFALFLWALAAQAAVASNFPITNGALADWRVWLVISAALELAAYRLKMMENSGEPPRQ